MVLNSAGVVVRTISGRLINGPWDMTAAQVGDDAVLFVTNVLKRSVTHRLSGHCAERGNGGTGCTRPADLPGSVRDGDCHRPFRAQRSVRPRRRSDGSWSGGPWGGAVCRLHRGQPHHGRPRAVLPAGSAVWSWLQRDICPVDQCSSA
jgi:hypothetical protein